ncbi:MAG: type II secretion system F family protein [Candidatus Omnitrophota bacterium]
MPQYKYTARDSKGKIIRGVVEAVSEADLAEMISQSDRYLTGFKAMPEESPKSKVKPSWMKPKETLQFTIHLATLVDSGLPLLDGLRDLAKEAQNERVQQVIDNIRYHVESGSSLKEAISRHPRTFSKLYEALVDTGESTGKLAQTLNSLANLLEWQLDLRVRIKEASTYPAILFFVMVSVVCLMIIHVIPIFEPIFTQAGVALPAATQIILGISHFLRSFWYLILAVIVMILLGYKFWKLTERGRYIIDSIRLRIPVFGELIRKLSLSRFTQTFALSFKAGVNLLNCLDISSKTCANARIENAILKARSSVNVGEKLAASFKATGEFPVMVVRMIEVGEQSGALTQTLFKAASFYDKEVASDIKRIFSIIEPAMIVIMGVVVGGISLAIFLPLFKMASIIAD